MQEKSELYKILAQLANIRQAKRISTDELEKKLILGPGWVKEFEDGKSIPRLDVFLSVIRELGVSLEELGLKGVPETELIRKFDAIEDKQDLILSFPYGRHDAEYRLKDASLSDFDKVLLTLRDGLSGSSDNSQQIKARAVADAFLQAVSLWPKANPSDLWWFLIYRAFLDPFNHPAVEARLSFDQSWKRTAGWALETVLVRHYENALAEKGIRLFIADNSTKIKLLDQVKSVSRMEADKADVLLTTTINNQETLFGVVHVKASFAERRTDDVPMSKDLIEAGYFSPLWTMDCKSGPAKMPINKGELGLTKDAKIDKRSAKRKDIEEDGYFSNCYSYNLNTRPTPEEQKAIANILTCDFQNTKDMFYEDVLKARKIFSNSN